MAQRAGAEILELEGSHVIMVSQPGPVCELIIRAIEAVAKPAGDLPSPRRPQSETAERAAGPS